MTGAAGLSPANPAGSSALLILPPEKGSGHV